MNRFNEFLEVLNNAFKTVDKIYALPKTISKNTKAHTEAWAFAHTSKYSNLSQTLFLELKVVRLCN